MTFRNLSNWLFSTNKQVPVQSQSPPPDNWRQNNAVKAKLSFSPVESPTTAKRPLMNHNFSNPSSSPSSLNKPHGHYHTSVGDYHMSRQNPDVLDQMYSPSSAVQKNHFLGIHQGTNDSTTSRKINGHFSQFVSPRTEASVYSKTPSQASLLRQMLNSRRSQSASPSSLVQLATRKGPGIRHGRVGRLLKNGVASPATVKLAGVKHKGGREEEKEPLQGMVSNGLEENPPPNPCDKEVILTALRQKRKRWATSAPEGNTSVLSSSSSTILSPPLAKRLRTGGVTVSVSQESVTTADRKRSHFATTAVSPPTKRSRVRGGECSNVLSFPDVECEVEPVVQDNQDKGDQKEQKRETSVVKESNKIILEGSRIPSITSSPHNAGHMSGTHTLPRIQAPPIKIDQAEISKKREESLHALKAVFTSSQEAKEKDSLRRKVPVFCATGAKPHLPSPLSSSHSVTHEDLRKDREATAAKLKAFLEADDETDSGVTQTSSQSSTVTSSQLPAVSLPTASQLPTTQTPSAVSATISIATTSKAPPTKTVTFALPAFANPLPSSLPALNAGTNSPVEGDSAKLPSAEVTSTASLQFGQVVNPLQSGLSAPTTQPVLPVPAKTTSSGGLTLQATATTTTASPPLTIASSTSCTASAAAVTTTASTQQPGLIQGNPLSLTGSLFQLPASSKTATSNATINLSQAQPAVITSTANPSISNQNLSGKPSFSFNVPATTQPNQTPASSMFNTGNASSLFNQTSQLTTQPSLINPSLSQSNAQPSLSLFKGASESGTQANAQSSSSLFKGASQQGTQANVQPSLSLFKGASQQGTQANAQPAQPSSSLFKGASQQVTQANVQPSLSLFKGASQQGTQASLLAPTPQLNTQLNSVLNQASQPSTKPSLFLAPPQTNIAQSPIFQALQTSQPGTKPSNPQALQPNPQSSLLKLPGSLFANSQALQATAQPSNFTSQPVATQASIFTSQPSNQTSIFTAQPSTQASIFKVPSQTSGAVVNSSAKSLSFNFGSQNANNTSATTGTLGQSSLLFGSQGTQAPSVNGGLTTQFKFGGQPQQQPGAGAGAFGGTGSLGFTAQTQNIFNGTQSQPKASNPMSFNFGQTNTLPGNNNQPAGIFGNPQAANKPMFQFGQSSASSTTGLNQNQSFIFGQSPAAPGSGISFGSGTLSGGNQSSLFQSPQQQPPIFSAGTGESTPTSRKSSKGRRRAKK